jgi:hypothetical protein
VDEGEVRAVVDEYIRDLLHTGDDTFRADPNAVELVVRDRRPDLYRWMETHSRKSGINALFQDWCARRQP